MLKKTAVPSKNLPLRKLYCDKSSGSKERKKCFKKRTELKNTSSETFSVEVNNEVIPVDKKNAAEALLLLHQQDLSGETQIAENYGEASTC